MKSVLKYIASFKKIQLQSNKQRNTDKRIFFFNSQNEGQGYTAIIEDLKDINDNFDIKIFNQLKQKVAIMKDCNHLNILSYKEDLIFEDKFIILMEKCNQSLKDCIQERYQYVQKNLQIFIDLALQLLNAVEHLHSKDLYLQNFNNENVFLDENANIKLHDFGERQVINTLQAYKQFQQGENQKSFHYFAPEQLDNSLEREVLQTAQADIWSVGISLYLSSGANLEHVYLLTRGLQEYQPQAQLNDELNLLLSQILSQDPNKRPQLSHIKQQFEIIKRNVNYEQNFNRQVQDDQEVEKFIKAQVLYLNDLNKESLQILEELIEKNQTNDMYYAWKARNLAIFKQFQESHESADKALSINPKNYIAFNVKGYIYSVCNQLQQAEEHLKSSVSLNPKFLTAVQNLGNHYEETFQTPQAIEMYEQSNLDNPNSIQIQNNLGRLYLNTQKYQESNKYLKQNLKLYPNNYFSLYNLAINAKIVKSYNKSKLFFFKIVKKDLVEGMAPILNQIGNVCYEKGQYEKSLKKYIKCQKLDPEEDAYEFNIQQIKKSI
ncbi:hypothetical protein ABPG72_006382 [Tetrahymena utriculariae]